VTSERPRGGSLTVVGTGIDIASHLTPQARAAFSSADEALYLVGDPVGTRVLAQLNPRARSLAAMYAEGKPRVETYEEMAEAMVAPVRDGRIVCAAFYGHPGVYVYPARLAIARCREEGFRARMFPGVSSIDCLFADLGLDPALRGCQIQHATDFLIATTEPDTTALLILLQIGALGQPRHSEQADWSRLPILVERLEEFYPREHEVIAYEASPFPVAGAVVIRAPLGDLSRQRLSVGMTLVVPPASEPEADAEMLKRLGLPPR
jgi:siroheme synthase